MAVEEQLQHDSITGMDGSNRTRIGQRITISNRSVTRLAFVLSKVNSPTGDITFNIRKVSNDASLGSKVMGDASSLTTFPVVTLKEVTFDTAITVNEEVRISTEFSGGDSGNQVAFSSWQAGSVKASD